MKQISKKINEHDVNKSLLFELFCDLFNEDFSFNLSIVKELDLREEAIFLHAIWDKEYPQYDRFPLLKSYDVDRVSKKICLDSAYFLNKENVKEIKFEHHIGLTAIIQIDFLNSQRLRFSGDVINDILTVSQI